MEGVAEDHVHSTGVYRLSRIAKEGLWLVTTEHAHDLAALFVRPQEFYESASEDIQGLPFSKAAYCRWYALNVSDIGSFTYATDAQAFNVPGEAVEACLQAPHPDTDTYDLILRDIASRASALQSGRYYLIGVRDGDRANLDHEIAHGMFYLLPKYRASMVALVEGLPEGMRDQVNGALLGRGYSLDTAVDETQAYFATGLLEELLHLEMERHPFMKVFAEHRRKIIKPSTEKPKRSRNVKKVKPEHATGDAFTIDMFDNAPKVTS